MDREATREDFEEIVTEILLGLDRLIVLRDGPDVDQARAAVMRELVTFADRVTLPLAQALRLIRDTSSGASSNTARRALEEACIPDPEDDDGC